MDTSFFFKGLLVGFLIAMPVGPIGVLCIQRTLNHGKLHGFVSGLGAATADTLYGFVAALGLTIVSNFLVEEQISFRLIGGIFLCYMGVRVFLSKPSNQTALVNSPSYAADYLSAFFLTLTNPMTLLAFAALFGGLGIISSRMHYASAGLLVPGVFIGSGLWWLILSTVAATLLGKLGYGKLVWLNKISGIVISCFGALVLLSLII